MNDEWWNKYSEMMSFYCKNCHTVLCIMTKITLKIEMQCIPHLHLVRNSLEALITSK